MMKADRKIEQEGEGPYEIALATALTDLMHAREKVAAAQEGLRSAEARVAELTVLVEDLIAILPPHRAALYKQKAGDLRFAQRASTRSGPIYENVIYLFAKENRREWTASEVQAALSGIGTKVDPKAVYNVLDYLVRKGSLRRMGRGQYYITTLGMGIQLAQDLEGVDNSGGGCMED